MRSPRVPDNLEELLSPSGEFYPYIPWLFDEAIGEGGDEWYRQLSQLVHDDKAEEVLKHIQEQIYKYALKQVVFSRIPPDSVVLPHMK